MSDTSKSVVGWGAVLAVFAVAILIFQMVPNGRSTPVAPTLGSDIPGGYPDGGPDQKDYVRMAGMRQAVLRNDRRWIPYMIALLEWPHDRFYYPVAMNALAQLGATEAIPAIRKVKDLRLPNFHTNPISHLQPFSEEGRVALARLNAEHTASPGEAGMAAKVGSFLQELDLSAGQLNAAAAKLPAHPEKPGYPIPLEIRAMRALADMAYQAHAKAPMAKLGLGGIDFSRDYPSTLKLKLAPLPDNERLDWLVSDLAMKTVTYEIGDSYEYQLVADQGAAADKAASQKLIEMFKEPARYPPSGFGNMCEIFSAVGTAEDLPMAARLMKSPDRDSAQTARGVHMQLSNGMSGRVYVPAY